MDIDAIFMYITYYGHTHNHTWICGDCDPHVHGQRVQDEQAAYSVNYTQGSIIIGRSRTEINNTKLKHYSLLFKWINDVLTHLHDEANEWFESTILTHTRPHTSLTNVKKNGWRVLRQRLTYTQSHITYGYHAIVINYNLHPSGAVKGSNVRHKNVFFWTRIIRTKYCAHRKMLNGQFSFKVKNVSRIQIPVPVECIVSF